MKSKEELQDLINMTQVFYFDKKLDYAVYNRHRQELINNVWIYWERFGKPPCFFPDSFGCMSTEYGCELINTIDRCIKNYNKDKGEFFTYLDNSIRTTLKQAINKNKYLEMNKGINVSRELEKLGKIIKRYAEEKNINLNSIKERNIIADIFNVPLEKIEKALKANYDITQDNIRKTEEDSKSEYIVDNVSFGLDYINKTCHKESYEEKLKIIEECFLSKQERTQKVLKPIITNIISGDIFDIEDWEEVIAKFSFYDKELLIKIREKGTKFQQKELAKELGKTCESISRTYNDFLREIKEKL